MEFLKEHLGEELYMQVVESLKDKGLKLADLSTGDYVAKGKYEAELNKNKTLTQNMTELTDKVKTYEGVDLEALKQQAITWEDKYNADMAKIKLETGIEKALIGAKARNMKAVKAMLNMDNIALDGDTVTGLEEQLSGLLKTDTYLFNVADEQQTRQTTGVKGLKPANTLTKEQIQTMTPAEINARWTEVQGVLNS